MPHDQNEPSTFSVLHAVGLLGDVEGGLGIEVEVFVFFDVSAVEVGDAFGGAEGNIDEEGGGLFFSDVGDKPAKFSSNFGIFGEDLFEVRVGSAVGLHHVEDDLVDAEVTEEAIDIEQMGQVAVGEDGGGMEFDPEAFELGDGLEACDGLFEAFGGTGEAFVELFCVSVDGNVEPVHAGFGEFGGVG